MIVIQVILIFGFIFLFWRFLANPGSHQVHAWIKILTFLFTILAIVVVAFPDISNSVAHSLGVKTGANLLLYLLTLAFIFAVINTYSRRKEDEKRVAVVVRRLAILEANLRQKKN